MIAFPVWINILPCFFGNLCVPSCQRASRANSVFICQMATIKILDSLAGFQGRAENILGKKNWHTVKSKQHVIQFSDIWNIMVFLLSCYLPTPPSCLSPNIWAKLTSPPPYLLHSKGIPCSSELQGLYWNATFFWVVLVGRWEICSKTFFPQSYALRMTVM